MIVVVDINPTPIWSLVAKAGSQLLLVNMDSAATITIGEANVTPGVSGAEAIIPPQGSVSIPASNTWYAISDTPNNPQLQVTLGGSGWSASPAGIAQAMITAGIPVLIAQELSQSGISLLAAPNQLYNIGGVSSPGGVGTSLVGWTVPNQAFNTGCYYASLAGSGQQDAGDSAFQGVVKRGLSNNRPPITKKFWNPGDYHTNNNYNNLANYFSYGTVVICCIKPLFTGTGQVSASEITNISNWCAALTALGGNANNVIVVVYQEPEVGNPSQVTTTQYQNIWAAVGPTIAAAGFPMVPDIGSGAGATVATSYANAAIASGVVFAGLASDFYYPVFKNTGTAVLTAMAAIADANNLPYGLFEFGIAPNNFPSNPSASSQYFAGITNFFQTRQQNNKKNLHFVWYDGQCSPVGAGDLTAPILNSTDPRVPLYDTLFDTLTSSTSSGSGGITIANNHTTTLTPSNPSTVGNLAIVNELTYELSLGLTAGVGSTIPFARVTLNWFAFDQLARNQVLVDSVQYLVPMGTNGDPNGPLIVRGRGSQRGSFLQVKVNNFDTVACTLTTFQLFDTSRIGLRDKWYWDISSGTSPTVPTFTLGNAAPASLEVGRITQVTVNPNSSKVFLLGMAAGQIYTRCHVANMTTAQLEVLIQPVPTNIFPATVAYIRQFLGASTPEFEGYFAAPRCALIVTLNNNSNTDTATVDVVLNAQEIS